MSVGCTGCDLLFSRRRENAWVPQSSSEPGAAPGEHEQTANFLFSDLTRRACSSGSKGTRACDRLYVANTLKE